MSLKKKSPLSLCIDQGGHASRALVFNSDGEVCASARVEVGTIRKAGGVVEQDPLEICRSIEQAVTCAVAELGQDAALISTAAMATQRSSIVCWDRSSGEPLSAVISWQDTRASGWLSAFKQSESLVRGITGLPISPHYGASKLHWCLANLRGVQQAHQEKRLVMGPLASYLLFNMLKEKPLMVDPANASRTLLWDLGKQDWSGELLELFTIPRDVLPASVPSLHNFGHLKVGSIEIPFKVLTGDQSAAFYALGQPSLKSAYLNVGTGAFVQRLFQQEPGLREQQPSRLLKSVVWQGSSSLEYVLEGTVNGAGSALVQMAEELGVDLESVRTRLGEVDLYGGDLPLFINGVSGLGSPYWMADFESRFEGKGSKLEKLAAVLESIAFLLQVNLDEMNKLMPPAEQIEISGGLSKIDSLCRAIACLNGTSVSRPLLSEATTRGLAFLAAGKPEHWPSVGKEASFSDIKDTRLQQRFERWKQHMPKLLD